VTDLEIKLLAQDIAIGALMAANPCAEALLRQKIDRLADLALSMDMTDRQIEFLRQTLLVHAGAGPS
jgi:hypothetical protein